MALDTVAPSLPARPDRSADKSLRVTAKERTAIAAMVWDGLPRRAAAEKAGILEHSLYKALRKPSVKAHYLAELEVLRSSERARNIHRLTEIRDAADNMPAVQAIKLLEQMPDENASAAKGLMPGFVVQIVNVQQVQAPAENAKTVLVSD